jgi:hypothetical protein
MDFTNDKCNNVEGAKEYVRRQQIRKKMKYNSEVITNSTNGLMTADNTEQYLFLQNYPSSPKKVAESPRRKSIKSPNLLDKITQQCADVNSGRTLNLADLENPAKPEFLIKNGSPNGVLSPPAMNKPKGFAAISAAKADDQDLRAKYAKMTHIKNPVFP